MTRIHIICEGQTEEAFIKNLLAEPFAKRGIYLLPSLIGKHGHKGGRVKFDRLLTDTRNRLLGDREAYCTTFFDFYALPTDFPGKSDAVAKASIADKARAVNEGVQQALEDKLGSGVMPRFIPYVQMYEFEALLFSNATGFAEGIYQAALAPKLQAIRDDFGSPEEINDDPNTAPSKRVQNLVADYEKPLYGTLAALKIGLPTMRQECALFDTWLTRLEQLKT